MEDILRAQTNVPFHAEQTLDSGRIQAYYEMLGEDLSGDYRIPPIMAGHLFSAQLARLTNVDGENATVIYLGQTMNYAEGFSNLMVGDSVTTDIKVLPPRKPGSPVRTVQTRILSGNTNVVDGTATIYLAPSDAAKISPVSALKEQGPYTAVDENEDIIREKLTINQNIVNIFGRSSGDKNPIHYNEAFARESMFGRIIPQGMTGVTLLYYAMAGNNFNLSSAELKFRLPWEMGTKAEARGRWSSAQQILSGLYDKYGNELISGVFTFKR